MRGRQPLSHGRDKMTRMRPVTSPDRSRDLVLAIEKTGYYPQVVASGVLAAVAGEEVEAFLVHHEPTIDERDEDIDATIQQAMEINDRPVVIDFTVSADAMVWPMVPAGVSNDEIQIAQGMSPEWERDI